MSRSSDYQLRKTAAWIIIRLDLFEELIAVVKQLATDITPNVRMIFAREIPIARAHDILKQLKSDSDPDVAFYASRKRKTI
jgi:hypothetical protein